MKFYYDLHLHSCLSPCGGDEMTPVDLAAMCALAGLNVVALTDHNTCGNCASFCRAADQWGLLALPGMELCTQEDIHVVCLLPDLETAARFQAHVAEHLSPFPNDPNVFGRQLYMDEGETVLGEEGAMLAGSTDIPLEEVPALVREYEGFAFPAHIDRPSYSLLGVLGLWDPSLDFPMAELSHRCPPDFSSRPDLAGLRFVTNSDAHYLDQVWGAEHAMELPALTSEAVFCWLRGEK